MIAIQTRQCHYFTSRTLVFVKLKSHQNKCLKEMYDSVKGTES